ncbi:hypothetical protein EON70_00550 [bacterium]|nr:MAG: hypothetical protein EON70_00550 [bacterium]
MDRRRTFNYVLNQNEVLVRSTMLYQNFVLVYVRQRFVAAFLRLIQKLLQRANSSVIKHRLLLCLSAC